MDKEKHEFLLQCGSTDRRKLLGEVRMEYEDFVRLVFLADYFGYDVYEKEIWKTFSPFFSELDVLEEQELSPDRIAAEQQKREAWIEHFMLQNV